MAAPAFNGNVLAAGHPVFDTAFYGALGDGSTDDTTHIVAAAQAAVNAGGGIVQLSGRVGNTFICNNANLPSGAPLVIRGNGIDATILKATTSLTSSVIQANGEVLFQDLTVDGNAVAVNGIAGIAASGVTVEYMALNRVRVKNISTTASGGNAWLFILWGQDPSGVNLKNVFISDVICEGPTNPNYDAFSVAGTKNCYVRGLTIDGVSRSPNLYQIENLYVDGVKAQGFTGAGQIGLVIDGYVKHAKISNVTNDNSAAFRINSPDAQLANCKFDAGVQVNYGNLLSRLKFVDCDSQSLGLQYAVDEVQIIGGEWGQGSDVILDSSPAGTTHNLIMLQGVTLAPTAHGNIVRSFNGTTVTKLLVEGCAGYSPGRVFYDGVTTSGSTTLTSATASFTSSDVGRVLTDAGSKAMIPAGTTISSVTNATTAVMSAAATGSSTGDLVAMGGLNITPYPTYNTTLGSKSRIASTRGYNPVGWLGTVSVPASGSAYTNGFNVDATVFVTGGTVTDIQINGHSTGVTSGPIRVPAGQSITLVYSAAPTWQWFGD